MGLPDLRFWDGGLDLTSPAFGGPDQKVASCGDATCTPMSQEACQKLSERHLCF